MDYTDSIKKKIEALAAEVTAGAITPPTVANILEALNTLVGETYKIDNLSIARMTGDMASLVLSVESLATGGSSTISCSLPIATAINAGLMSSGDKQTLAAVEKSTTELTTELQSTEADIAKHSTRLDTAEAAIKADEEKLESTINDVATNAKGIAENKTAIATNTKAIATNTKAIATNTKAIKELQKTYSPIQVKIIGGKPKLINYADYVKDGMVLLLYRSCRKQNRNRFAEEYGDPRNPVTKGWNMMGRDNSVRLLKTSSVLGFNNREHQRWHENNVTDANFECDASLLVEPHEDRDGNSIVSWGKRQVSLDDAKGKPRMLRFRFAVGYAKPFDTKTKTSDVYQLVSNLAEFSVVYSMSADGYYWKFSR